jgi:NAD(P)-dependent dehydrogenase (short-subunit alcohol dehydrogenase family)
VADDPTRVALVTGGAGGIGSAMVRHLAARGLRPVVADVDLAAARRLADEVDGAAVEVDVGDYSSNHAMVGSVLDRYGRLDLVALNAGVNSGQRAADPLDPAKVARVTAVNLLSVVYGIDAATPALARQGGAVVVTCSLAALAPEVSPPLYVMTKAGALAYVRAMARHLTPRGITVNALCPAFVDTAMLGAGREWLVGQGFPMLTPDDIAAQLLAVVDSGATGQAWAMVAGRPPTPYEFPATPDPLHPDGSPARLSLG